MEQSKDVIELSLLMQHVSCNTSSGVAVLYNFTHATANQLIHEYLRKMYTLHEPATIALLCLYIPVFVMSLTGNGLVILVVFRHKHMRRVKNLFLVNLAVADLLVTLLCIPINAAQSVFRLWVYGDVMCKLTGYMQGVAVTSSVLTLTGLSIDRYLAIKAPLRLRNLSARWHAAPALVLVWLISAVFILPLLFVRSVYTYEFSCFDSHVSYCIESWSSYTHRRAFGLVSLGFGYIVPMTVIAFCYFMIGRALFTDEFHRETTDSSSTVMLGRKRVARMLLVLIAVFLISWLPYNACSLSLDWNAYYGDTRVLPFTMWLGHSHSAINPLLYWFLNKRFRHCMTNVLRCGSVGRGSRDSPPAPQLHGDMGDILRYDFPLKECLPQVPHLSEELQGSVGRARRQVQIPRIVEHPADSDSEVHSQVLNSPQTYSSHLTTTSPFAPNPGGYGSYEVVQLELHRPPPTTPPITPSPRPSPSRVLEEESGSGSSLRATSPSSSYHGFHTTHSISV